MEGWDLGTAGRPAGGVSVWSLGLGGTGEEGVRVRVWGVSV